jgi:hypothetical protein
MISLDGIQPLDMEDLSELFEEEDVILLPVLP